MLTLSNIIKSSEKKVDVETHTNVQVNTPDPRLVSVSIKLESIEMKCQYQGQSKQLNFPQFT